MHKKEHDMDFYMDKNIRKICLISSTAFALSSVVYGWAEPIGALFGLISDITDDKHPELKEEMESAVKEALDMLLEKAPTNSCKRIAQELMYENITDPDNIDKILEEASKYHAEYFTDKDKEPTRH